jgi:hypothetical protein
MWTYEQESGKLSNGFATFTGYSGHGEGLNNPAMQDVHDVGPIPQGRYRIAGWYDDTEKGPCVARLEPLPETNTYGRVGFLIHGDNSQLNHTASHGCIIQAKTARQYVRSTGDTLLEVTA